MPNHWRFFAKNATSRATLPTSSLRAETSPVYTGPRELLASLTGYTLTRGVLCAMRRPTRPALKMFARAPAASWSSTAWSTPPNIGAIFRSAAALGIDAVLLTTTSCDPLNRAVPRLHGLRFPSSVDVAPKRLSRPCGKLGFKTIPLWRFATSPSPSTAPV